ncbi:UNVERIFIED_CONTAM: hypothetical protein RMT77_001452 [Armadillidium vulgare]
MNYKLCIFLILFSLSSAFAGKLKKEKIDEKCGTDTTCHAAAKRCLGNKDEKPPKDEGGLSHSEKLAAFNKCLDDNQQGSLKINESDCMNESPSEGELEREVRSHHENCKLEIMNVLTELNETIAAPIRCCFATAIKTNRVTSEGSINLDYFRQRLSERFTNETIINIYKTAFNICLPEGINCNVFGFKECIVNKCIDKLLEHETQI